MFSWKNNVFGRLVPHCGGSVGERGVGSSSTGTRVVVVGVDPDPSGSSHQTDEEEEEDLPQYVRDDRTLRVWDCFADPL